MIILKEYCKDILEKIDQLGAGECSLKGLIAHRLYTIQTKMKTIQTEIDVMYLQYFEILNFEKTV